jgi:hypothetical protein
MYFILTIDTEGDNQWDHGRKVTVENIKFIPRFQDLCGRYSIKPTYLVTSEVCDDNYASELFSGYIKDDIAEVGAHLHSWTTPPYLDREGFRYNDPNHAFATELPYDLMTQKIRSLTAQITDSFGRHPKSFRSGRYGLNNEVAKVLIENSYLVDSSVTPFINWTVHKGVPDGHGGPDFLDYEPYPYDYNFPEGSIREIPITILPTRFPLNINWNLARYYFRNVNDNLLLRTFRRFFLSNQPIWARPVPGMTLKVFIEMLHEIMRNGLPFITMMFHSSELMPGCSKYRPDNISIEELYQLLEGIFKMLDQNHIEPATLTEAAQVQVK